MADFDQRAWAYTTRAIATDPPGSPIPFVAASPGLKRDGMTLRLPFDLSRFEKCPVVLFVHEDRTLSIGRATMAQTKVATGWVLTSEVIFDIKDPLGAEADRKYREGFLFAVSLGWYDVDENGDPVQITRRKPVAHQVVELSICNVPMDADALVVLPRRMRSVYRSMAENVLANADEASAERHRDTLERMTRAFVTCDGPNCRLPAPDPLPTSQEMQTARVMMAAALWSQTGRRQAYERAAAGYRRLGLEAPGYVDDAEWADMTEEERMATLREDELTVVGGLDEADDEQDGGVSEEEPAADGVERETRRLTVGGTKKMSGVASLLRGMRGSIDSLREMLDKAEAEIEGLLKEVGRTSRRRTRAGEYEAYAVGGPASADSTPIEADAERSTRMDDMGAEQVGTYFGDYVKARVNETVAPDDPDAFDTAIEELARAASVPVLRFYRVLDGEGGCLTTEQINAVASAIDVEPEVLIALAGADGCSFATNEAGEPLTIEQLVYGVTEVAPVEPGTAAMEAGTPGQRAVPTSRRGPGERNKRDCGCGGGIRPSHPLAGTPRAPRSNRASEPGATVDEVMRAIRTLEARLTEPAPTTPQPVAPQPVAAETVQDAVEPNTRGGMLGATLQEVLGQAASALGTTMNQIVALLSDATGAALTDVMMYASGQGCPSPEWLTAAADLLAMDPAVLMKAAEQDGCMTRQTMSMETDAAPNADPESASLLAQIDAMLAES